MPSVLYPPGYPPPRNAPGDPEPDCFRDLNLDQVVESVARPYAEYDLEPYFHATLRSVDAVTYRHEVFRDLSRAPVRECVGRFADRMRRVRAQRETAHSMRYAQQQQRWLLQAASTYRGAVQALAASLPAAGIASAGLSAIAAYVKDYAASPAFTEFAGTIEEIDRALAAIRYSLHIRGSTITITRYAGESDYGAQVDDTFARFQDSSAAPGSTRNDQSHDRLARDRGGASRRPTTGIGLAMDHIEAGVLGAVVKLFPDEFAALATFANRYADFADPAVEQFDREVQFYLAYLDHMAAISATGLPFCFPDLAAGKAVDVTSAFDLALAGKNAASGQPVVTNDVRITGTARIAVVTGANQGGKTTFARTVGQLHYLAALGAPIPGARARLGLCDAVLTHFERQEDLADLRGKLEDDLVRIREILDVATPASVIILNEVFTSTAAVDAELLGQRILDALVERDAVGVYVTFVDELAALGPAVVSYVATVDERDAARRTYAVVQRPADGRAYAQTLAARYGLTYELLRKRVAS